jgi:hypothetical protein
MKRKFWITAMTFGLPWTISMIIYYSIVKGGLTVSIIISTSFAGLLTGLLFSSSMTYAAKRLVKKIIVDIADNEIIVKEGGANHFRGKEGVGGKLVLTDRRLIFKSHKFNIQNNSKSSRQF